MRTPTRFLTALGLAAVVVLAAAACGSTSPTGIVDGAPTTAAGGVTAPTSGGGGGATATTGSATPVRHYPPVPAGGTDCGIVDEMSGWPTTVTMPTAQVSACITQAAAAGHPARFVLISASQVDSGRKTSDGYALPAAIVTTYVVTGPGRIEVTEDQREAGGPVATQLCTGLPAPTDGQALTPTGCTPP